MAEGASSKRLEFAWRFDRNGTIQWRSCACVECHSLSQRGRFLKDTFFEVYRNLGLELNYCDTEISLATFAKASEILASLSRAANSARSLQVLTVAAVSKNDDIDDLDDLPLPTLIINSIYDYIVFDYEDVDDEIRRRVNYMTVRIPQMLYGHMGYCLREVD